ncbi:methylated-DNA--[protein]-cysteine S-methyltransferase [Curvivirga sp.]|uniref:methylated-DNA--[protein]-cysteine S-methyltransferase n=1 Tax=Curvivirga sp. TaxID=2856848 RepID=UPI003B58D270
MTQNSYDKVAQALEFIADHWDEQPELSEIATQVRMNEFNFQKLFSEWVGISPKKFISVLTLEHAKQSLADNESVLGAALDSGLSGPSRLHDLFVSVEAMTPGEYKQQAKGLKIRYAWHRGIFGETLILATERGLCGVAFLDSRGKQECFDDMARRWPLAQLIEDFDYTYPYMEQIFNHPDQVDPSKHANLKLFIKGSEFQVKVWQALMEIPKGQLVTYGDIAKKLDMKTGAARAIGTAIGSNPVGWVIPCHRVIRNTGYLGGYRWGLPRKLAMMGYEAAS